MTVVVITIAALGIAIGGTLISLGLFLAYAPIVKTAVNEGIKDSTKLKNGTQQFERWQKPPVVLNFHVYIFNVSNPDEIVHNGAKPKVKEIGPFVYKQHLQKRGVRYSATNDTLTYKQFARLEFDAAASPYSENQELTILNLPLQGVFQNEEAGKLPATLQGISVNLLWTQAFPGDGMFMNVTPKALFFEGLTFCITDKQEMKPKKGIIGGIVDGLVGGTMDIGKNLFCNEVKKVSASNPTIVADKKKLRFSFFAHKQDQSDGVFEVSAGTKDIRSLGQIASWEKKKHTDAWNGPHSKCNQIKGTDSSIYAPFNNDSSTFYTYSADICKTSLLKTTDSVFYKGVKGIKAIMGPENFANDGENSCYCIKKTRNLDGKLDCFPNGLVDMNNCLKAPVVVSFPHHMWTDKRYRNTVEGLKPDESKHTSYLVMEPNTGTPLQGRKRIQFNSIIRPIQKISITEKIKPALVPVIWIDERFDLPDNLVYQLKQDFINKMSLIDQVTYTTIGIGSLCMVAALAYFFFPKF